MADWPTAIVLDEYARGEVAWEVVLGVAQDWGIKRSGTTAVAHDHCTMPGSFEDTATHAVQTRVITRDQWRELRAVWRSHSTGSPAPVRGSGLTAWCRGRSPCTAH